MSPIEQAAKAAYEQHRRSFGELPSEWDRLYPEVREGWVKVAGACVTEHDIACEANQIPGAAQC